MCTSLPCQHDGICSLDPAGYVVCDCTGTGYTSVFCEIEVNECDSDPCENNGICTDLLLEYTCNCIGTGKHKPCHLWTQA